MVHFRTFICFVVGHVCPCPRCYRSECQTCWKEYNALSCFLQQPVPNVYIVHCKITVRTQSAQGVQHKILDPLHWNFLVSIPTSMTIHSTILYYCWHLQHLPVYASTLLNTPKSEPLKKNLKVFLSQSNFQPALKVTSVPWFSFIKRMYRRSLKLSQAGAPPTPASQFTALCCHALNHLHLCI